MKPSNFPKSSIFSFYSRNLATDQHTGVKEPEISFPFHVWKVIGDARHKTEMAVVTFRPASVTLDAVKALVILPSHWSSWFWLYTLPNERLWEKFVCGGGRHDALVELYEWIYFGRSFLSCPNFFF